MTSRRNQSLRLVGQQDPETVSAWSIARENTAAAAAELDPKDPRWVLAARVQSELQGTLLTPERRQRVLTTAEAMGVRVFDANMIIALVQDKARRGEPLAAAAPQLSMMREQAVRPRRRDVMRLISAVACAAVIAALMIRWILG